jgi:hypothetical protein
MTMSQEKAKTPAAAAAAANANRRRYTVLWVVSGRERRSARITEAEAQRLVERLTAEKAQGVRIDESDDPVYVRFRPT